MQCIVLNAQSQLIPDASSIETCTGWVALEPFEFQAMIEAQQVSSSEIALTFTWAFGVVLFFWSIGAGIGAAKRAVNKT